MISENRSSAASKSAHVPVNPGVAQSGELGRMIRLLRGQLDGEVRSDDMSRSLYSTDASMYQMSPLAVVIPRSVRDVQRTVEAAHTFGIPILARGGASSLAGQAVAEAVVIDFTNHLNRIHEINVEERWARVEPGVLLDDLNRAARSHGLMVGPDPASSNRATLGGMVANNSTGTHSILYGNVINHIVSLDVILADGTPATLATDGADDADGEASATPGMIRAALRSLVSDGEEVIRRDTPRHWRRNSGYRLESLLEPQPNLAKLICGSEGTLAVITGIKIALVPIPKVTALGVVHFHTRSEALRSVEAILATKPSAVELFDGVSLHQFRQLEGLGKSIDFVEGEPGGLLLTEYYGDTDADVADGLARLRDAVAALPWGYAVIERTTPRDIAAVWSVRKEALGLIMGTRGRRRPMAFIEDAAVPVEHLADYIERLDRFLVATETPVAYYAHASGGCLHVRPFVDTKDASEIAKMRRISLESMRLVRSFGGSVSSEHGDGIARSWLNREILGPQLYALNQRLKQIFDPNGILNPGKIVDAPDMTEHLRYGVGYTFEVPQTNLDFSANDGFDAAVELCSGVGSCRKVNVGTMCPSFMVTLDEEHTTRGRANALRNALSGQLAPGSLTSRRMYEVMELCIQCKSCKTECPSNVDMAKIKTEWLNEYWRENGLPLRTRLFGILPDISSRVSGRIAPLVNAVNRSAVGKRIIGRVLNVSRDRTLPEFARHPFRPPSAAADPDPSRPTVILFVDTFARYHETDVAADAFEVLTRVGYNVVVPTERVCCGRTRLSKGMLDSARHTMSTTVSVLSALRTDVPIVGLEPSCVSALSDDLRSILPGVGAAASIADRVISFERLVAEDADGLFAEARFDAEGRSVLLHGHCHQKSLEGMAPVVSALARTGASITALDSGCCGMAGSFGYEAEHDAISRKMAELRLAPAVRSVSTETTIVAPGTSCRSQIHDVASREAVHPATYLRSVLR